MLNQFRELARYQEWADSQFFKSWKELSQAHDDKEIRLLTDHFTNVQKFFLHLLHEEKVDLPDRNAAPGVMDELLQRCRQNHARLDNYLSVLSSEKLSATLYIPWFPGGNFKPTVSEVLLQVILHTQHHRAQALRSLAGYGKKSIVVDWISWIFRERPIPVWE